MRAVPLTAIPIQFRPSTVSLASDSQRPLQPHRRGRHNPPQIPDGLLSKPNKPQIPKEKEDEESRISGSDVLWALRRAAEEKKRKKKKKMKMKGNAGVQSSAGESTGEGRVDYSNMRPLRIKSEWGAKLDELELRLEELQDTI